MGVNSTTLTGTTLPERTVDASPTTDQISLTWREFAIFYGLLAALVVVVYSGNEQLSRLFVIGLLFSYVISKREYFWFAFFFVISEGPGFLFFDFRGDSVTRLPLFTILPGISLTVSDIFVLLTIIKAIAKYNKKPVQFMLHKQVALFFLLFFFGVLNGVFHQDSSIAFLALSGKAFYYYCVYFTFVVLIRDFENLIKFFKLLIPIVTFELFTQLYRTINQQHFVNALLERGGNVFHAREIGNSVTGGVRPYFGGVFIFYFVFTACIYLLVSSKNLLKKSVYLFVIMGCVISFILSASRGWAVTAAVVFMLVFYKPRSVYFWLIILLLFTFSFSLEMSTISSKWGVNNEVVTTIANGIERIRDLEKLYNGGYRSIDTANARYWEFQDIKDALLKRPFLGHGYADYNFEVFEDDLGVPNTVLRFGIFGLMVVTYIWYYCLKLLFKGVVGFKNPDKQKLAYVMFASWIATGFHYLYQDTFTSIFWYVIMVTAIMFGVIDIISRELLLEKQMLQRTKISSNPQPTTPHDTVIASST